MASPSGQQAAYELRAPKSGPGILDPRTALLFWGAGSVALGLTVSILLAQGQIRNLVLLLLGVLGMLSLAPKRGVYILLVFLPFMYFIRRQVLNFEEWDRRDPILLFPAITTAAIFLGVLIFRGRVIFRCFRRSTTLKLVTALMFLFAIQILNPLQGSILVGVAGAMYFLVPIAWCYLGLLLDREDMSRIFRIIVILGLITAVYGLYQHYFGLSQVEIYELRSKDFLKSFGGVDNVRIMSTFSSLGDFSLYLVVAGLLTFAAFWFSKQNIFLLGVFLLEIYTMVWMAVRTAFLLLLFSVTMFVIVQARSRMRIYLRGAVAIVLFVGTYATLSTYNPERIYNQDFSSNPYVVHSLSGVTHPLQENTFQMRLQNWKYIVTSTLMQFQAGRGLGSTTTAAKKFEGGRPFEADSYFFELFYGSGVLAPVLFGGIAILSLRRLLDLSLARPGVRQYRVALGLLCGAFLGSVFGGAVRDTITGPLLWLTVGWTLREGVDQAEEAAGAPSAQA
ncbi:MAG TPA: hypothetical protein VJV23_06645 [Candidatus Polarisedimenticolia bacterium]|nr:hypothetical protein [Candidatus Polarisedimenticolia bacterium]